MDVEARFKAIADYAAEVVTPSELRALLEAKAHPRAYIGFEPSGRLHIGHIVTANMVRRMQRAGCHVIIFLADWHAMINDKFGGDMAAIRACGQYQREGFLAMGVDPAGTEFKWAADFAADAAYWEKVVRAAKASSLARVKRALTIMGRKEDDAEVDASKLIYPAMQVADIFHMELDIALGGLDQRKAHMLARDVCDKTGWKKPVAVHTPLITSLKGGDRMDPVEGKMSKSEPGSAIALTDTPQEIAAKVKQAFCPKEVAGNPVMEIYKFLVFEHLGGKPLLVRRDAKYGGDLELPSYAALERVYTEGKLHAGDLKAELARQLGEMTAPVREHFARHPDALAWLARTAPSR